jgi:hypothetical protein
MQLAYSPVFKANQLGIANSLIQMIDRNKDNLRQNVPEPYRYNSLAVVAPRGQAYGVLFFWQKMFHWMRLPMVKRS